MSTKVLTTREAAKALRAEMRKGRFGLPVDVIPSADDPGFEYAVVQVSFPDESDEDRKEIERFEAMIPRLNRTIFKGWGSEQPGIGTGAGSTEFDWASPFKATNPKRDT